MGGISIENPEWSAREEQTIEAALFTRPHTVIGLTDGYLPSRRILDLLSRLSHIITIECDWLEMQQRLLEEIDAEPERVPEFMENEIPDLHTLKILHRQRAPLYSLGDITLQSSGLSPAVVANRATAAMHRLT